MQAQAGSPPAKPTNTLVAMPLSARTAIGTTAHPLNVLCAAADPLTLVRPCVDCGRYTGRFCDGTYGT